MLCIQNTKLLFLCVNYLPCSDTFYKGLRLHILTKIINFSFVVGASTGHRLILCKSGFLFHGRICIGSLAYTQKRYSILLGGVTWMDDSTLSDDVQTGEKRQLPSFV
jgi:hypothetical protein